MRKEEKDKISSACEDEEKYETTSSPIKKERNVDYQLYSAYLRTTDIGAKKPLKMLCLHGAGSNNDITSIQLASVGVSQKLELDLMHGALESQAYAPTFHRLSGKAFWRWWDSKSPSSLLEVLVSLAKTIEREGPYDGLFGFSQGSFLVALLSSPNIAEILGINRTWNFVMIAGGYYGHLDILKEMLQVNDKSAKMPSPQSIEIPSLHMIGKCDPYRESAERLSKLFKAASVVYHDRGHELPLVLLQDKSFQAAVDSFLKQQLKTS